MILFLHPSQDKHCINCSSLRHTAKLHFQTDPILPSVFVQHHFHLHTMLKRRHNSIAAAILDVPDHHTVYLFPFIPSFLAHCLIHLTSTTHSHHPLSQFFSNLSLLSTLPTLTPRSNLHPRALIRPPVILSRMPASSDYVDPIYLIYFYLLYIDKIVGEGTRLLIDLSL